MPNRTRSDSPTKTCTQDGCGRALRARGLCASQLCGTLCTAPDPYALTSATVDHVVPISRGGEHSLANAQTLCLSCNSTKQDQTP